MSQEDDHVASLQEAYRQWHETKGASVDHWMSLIADDCCFGSLAGGSPGMEFTRACHSKDEIRAYFEGLGADWEMLHYSPEDYVAQGDRVVMLGRCAFRHRRSGREVETPKADSFRFRDGRIVDFFEYYCTASTLAAAAPD